MKSIGSCHCGEIRFEVEGAPEEGMACNCSICQRKGSIMWFLPANKFRLLSSPENLSTYTFNKHAIKHRFCATCGMHPYGEGVDPSTNTTMVAINIRCLEDINLETIPVKIFDGKAL